MSSSLDDLIILVGNKDIDALEKLYNETKTFIYAISLSILKNRHDAEDILHDTFIKVYENAHTYSSYGKAKSWLITIAKNLSIMKLRKKRKMVEIAVLDDDFKTVANYDSLILETAFSILKEEELEIILLYSTYGFKHQEIADTLNIPLSTVLSKYHRSLKKMQAHLEGGRK